MRKRFTIRDGELVEVTTDEPPKNSDHVLWNDRLYQDGGDQRFLSREKHREYMKQHGITTVDDFKGYFKDAEKKRMDVRQGVDPSRREDIVKTMRRLDGRRRR